MNITNSQRGQGLFIQRWHIGTAEGVYSDPNFQYGLTMPRDIVLIKQ